MTNKLKQVMLLASKDGSDWAIGQKIRWYADHFPHLQVICCKSKDKLLHMLPDRHNVLIDDWTQHQKKWEDAGGTFIVHTSAKQSLADLDQLIFELEHFKPTISGRFAAENPTFSNKPKHNR